jgi:hypothetical protein
MPAPLKVVEEGESVHGEQAEACPSSVEADSSQESSTRFRLERARWQVKRAWRRAITELSSLGRESRLMGQKSRSYLGETIDDESQACPSGAHIWAASSEVRKSMALALLASVDAETARGDESAPIGDHLLLAAEDLGGLCCVHRRAIADGKYSRAELLELVDAHRKVTEDLGVLGRDLLRALERAEKGGGKTGLRTTAARLRAGQPHTGRRARGGLDDA